MLETETHCIDYEDKVQSVTDADNEFSECQRPRNKLQSIGIWPVSLCAEKSGWDTSKTCSQKREN